MGLCVALPFCASMSGSSPPRRSLSAFRSSAAPMAAESSSPASHGQESGALELAADVVAAQLSANAKDQFWTFLCRIHYDDRLKVCNFLPTALLNKLMDYLHTQTRELQPDGPANHSSFCNNNVAESMAMVAAIWLPQDSSDDDPPNDDDKAAVVGNMIMEVCSSEKTQDGDDRLRCSSACCWPCSPA